MTAAELRHRCALRLSKTGDARFLGHLDLQRAVERAFRRSRLPVWSTQGFNPRFKLIFADALPVGMASAGEWITFLLTQDLSPDDIREALEPTLPSGLRLIEVRRGDAPQPDSTVGYSLELRSGARSAADALTALLDHEDYHVEDPRRGGRKDIRPALVGGKVVDDHLYLTLAVTEGRPARPGPVVEALKALARDAGGEVPTFGLPEKLCTEPRRPGDTPWLDAAAASPPHESSSSTLVRPKRVG